MAATAPLTVSPDEDLHSRVMLHVSCQNLPNLDTFSKSDPMVVVSLSDGGRWYEYERTEVIMDNLNPKFVTPIAVDYFFEERCPLKFTVVDVDGDPASPLSAHDLIGEVVVELAEIVVADGGTLYRRFDKYPGAQITIRGEEVVEMSYTVSFQFGGKKLDKMDWGFGKSDPFLVLSKCCEDGSFTPVFTTNVIMRNLNPTWNPFTVPAGQLCNGDFDRPILVECWDWNRSGSHDSIGSFQTSVRELVEHNGAAFPLINEQKQRKNPSKYTNSGTIHVLSSQLVHVPSFLDYVSGGCEISLMVAIDFTASNGKPNLSTSLHYNNPYQPNQYVSAINSVGGILDHYDTDHMYPVYGFGAKLPDGSVSHCFACNGNESNPNVVGVDGIIEAYEKALTNVKLHGPTLFSQIIETGAAFSRTGGPGEQKWTILLILTDGVVNDFDRTRNAIVAASDMPLSIVIVGVGNADFSEMERLDGDDVVLKNTAGQECVRDIVQFVPFSDFENAPARLAKEVLAEVPQQLVAYFKAHNIAPNPPREAAPPPPFEEAIAAPPPAYGS